MKKVLKAFLVMFLMATVLNASSLKESLKVDGYNLELTSKRDLSAGSNEFFVKITKDGKEVNDAKIKAKFFMPEMPGMPYMEHEGEGKFENGIYSFVINFCMDGTWQYNIRFKTADDKVHSVKSSVSF
ncbi:FixH family protein [Aliarcobacter cryaerophilus]|uniref:FixH family protein n=1 Tax=Aliarcobacter cryaerophilus TaxID=28198 RepID=UPI0021B633FB|nr:FixH family protein [Aliarcobacter cryaerophilus]MCT7545138.1 FixH family protein [Aliarcobacter cryaerophilus]